MLLDIAKLLLGPWLVVQGRRVRTQTPRLPEPEGPRQGGRGPLRLLVVGDSSAAGVGAERFEQTLTGRLVERLGGLEALRYELVARTGWTTARALEALRDREGPFDLAVTALGVNDLTAGIGSREAAELHRQLLTDLTGRLGARLVVVSGVPPIRAFPALPEPLRHYLAWRGDAYDRALEAVAHEFPAVRRIAPSEPLDGGAMASDGFHPGPAAYDAWSVRVLEAAHAAGIAPGP